MYSAKLQLTWHKSKIDQLIRNYSGSSSNTEGYAPKLNIHLI